MKGRRFMSALSFIRPQYIQEAEQDALSENGEAVTARRHGRPKLLLIAAIMAAMVFLMGAAVYTRWSGSLQSRHRPSEAAKQQAEKSGLSVMYDPTESENGDVLTATDQGITVTVVQTIVDKIKAEIVLRVEGFTPPEDYRIHPNVWMEVPATLGGDEHFWGSSDHTFNNGIIHTDEGTWVYEDGTPVEEDEDGWQKGRYIKEDGSLELVLTYYFHDTSGANLGKELQLHFTGFGIRTDTGKAEATYEKLVDGRWDLHWTLNGSDETIDIAPDVRLSDNVTLLDAEIGQLSIRATYRTDTYWDGWETLELLSPGLAGVQLKDGTLIQCSPASEGYQDRDNLIYFVEYRTYQGTIDLSQAQALAYYDGWENDADGNPTIPIYKYVPIS